MSGVLYGNSTTAGVDNMITGGNRTDSTPAAAANGGPISGLIPSNVGNAPLSPGDGGFGATTANC